jgi:hypothetical protein
MQMVPSFARLLGRGVRVYVGMAWVCCASRVRFLRTFFGKRFNVPLENQ